jgi:hypothetical protein
MAFDAATGHLWLGDVGQNAREEINVIVRGGNYGWSYREGTHRRPAGQPSRRRGRHLPAAHLGISQPRAGPVGHGGFVYRGSRYADLAGHYLCADFVSGRIWALRPDGTNPVGADRVRQIARASDGGISVPRPRPRHRRHPALGPLTENALKSFASSPRPPAAPPIPLPSHPRRHGLPSPTSPRSPPRPASSPTSPTRRPGPTTRRKRHWFAAARAPPAAFRQGASAQENRWAHPAGAVWIQTPRPRRSRAASRPPQCAGSRPASS